MLERGAVGAARPDEAPRGAVGDGQDRDAGGKLVAIAARQGFPLAPVAREDVDPLGKAGERGRAVEHVADRRGEEPRRSR